MHSNAALNLFPWGWTTTYAPNDADLRNIGAHMSALNAGRATATSTASRPNCLYTVDGDSVDWAYGELGIAAYTTEVGGSELLPGLLRASIRSGTRTRAAHLPGEDRPHALPDHPRPRRQHVPPPADDGDPGHPVAPDAPPSTTPGPATPTRRTWPPPSITSTPRPGPAAPPSP